MKQYMGYIGAIFGAILGVAFVWIVQKVFGQEFSLRGPQLFAILTCSYGGFKAWDEESDQ